MVADLNQGIITSSLLILYFFQRTIVDTVEGEVGHHHPLEIGLLQEEDTAGNHYKSDIANKQFVYNIALIYVIFTLFIMMQV